MTPGGVGGPPRHLASADSPGVNGLAQADSNTDKQPVKTSMTRKAWPARKQKCAFPARGSGRGDQSPLSPAPGLASALWSHQSCTCTPVPEDSLLSKQQHCIYTYELNGIHSSVPKPKMGQEQHGWDGSDLGCSHRTGRCEKQRGPAKGHLPSRSCQQPPRWPSVTPSHPEVVPPTGSQSGSLSVTTALCTWWQ